MATEIGAAIEDMLALEILGPFVGLENIRLIVGRPETIWINKKGERFADESISMLFTEAANSIYRQPGKKSYTILDEKIKKEIIQDVPNMHKPWVDLGDPEIWEKVVNDELQDKVDYGKAKVSVAWDDIAKWMGADTEVLKSTINKYNDFCIHGHDEDFVKDKKYLLPLYTPPYYAIQCCIDCVATHGGVKVSQYLEVLNHQDNPIPGLYAAGVEIGGTESDTYNVNYPGHSFGFTINSGRIAGESVAQYIVKNE